MSLPRRAAPDRWDFTDENGEPIPGAIQRPGPRPKKKGRVKTGKEWSAGTKGPCALCSPMRRRGRRARQAHHVLPQQDIRNYVRSLRIRNEGEERRLLRRLLNDKRNRMWLCLDCHYDFEHGSLVIYRHQIPQSAWNFAREMGEPYVAKLERAYPALEPSDDASVRPNP